MNTQFSLGTKIKVGIIGFGRMGNSTGMRCGKVAMGYCLYLVIRILHHVNWQKTLSPESYVIKDNQKIFEDESVQVVGFLH